MGWRIEVGCLLVLTVRCENDVCYYDNKGVKFWWCVDEAAVGLEPAPVMRFADNTPRHFLPFMCALITIKKQLTSVFYRDIMIMSHLILVFNARRY